MERWFIKNKKADFELIMRECGISEVLARCLVNKGYEKPDEIMEFLHPRIENLHDPYLLKDMEKAVKILKDKIASGKKIRIIGDYDVDGIISVYLLIRTMRMLNADIDYVIPDRIRDGYGINTAMVENADKDGVDTILTCDNGIMATEQVQRAKALGMTVIITDHHSLVTDSESHMPLPEADAIVNPRQPDCTYPYKELCGAAVAYKLVLALLDGYGMHLKEYEEELLSYTAIATVCDVMDLTGENRIIVRHGISMLKKTQNYGLKALMEANNIIACQFSVFHLGFILGPCLNASGRLDTATKGLELLLTDDYDKACKLAFEVLELNTARKDMTAENVEKAIRIIEEEGMAKDRVLVVYLKDCHESIAGIIAGRIREIFHRPTLILTDAKDCIKGSGRSVEQYNMIEELLRHRDFFIKAGGHPMAAGFSLMPDKIVPLRIALNESTSLTEDMLEPRVVIDIRLPFGYLSEELVNELKLLEPCGKGNERPLFAEKDVRIKSVFVIGKNASGLRFMLENRYGRLIEAVYFGDAEEFFTYIRNNYGEEEADRLKTGRASSVLISVTYYPRVNEYNGFKNIQIVVKNYR
jgi:single-stranded-DNA-specific exonuclease